MFPLSIGEYKIVSFEKLMMNQTEILIFWTKKYTSGVYEVIFDLSLLVPVHYSAHIENDFPNHMLTEKILIFFFIFHDIF